MALDRMAVGQDQLFQLTAIVELQPWTSSDWDAIERPILRKCRTDELSFVIERNPRLPWKRSADEDVFTRERGDRKSPVLVETHLQVAAGAEDALNVAIACQLETAEALVRVEHDECSAAARQAVDLLILTQVHIAEVPLLVAPEVPDKGPRSELSAANGVLTRQRDANWLTPGIEPSLVP